jgi:hypothetical protein
LIRNREGGKDRKEQQLGRKEGRKKEAIRKDGEDGKRRKKDQEEGKKDQEEGTEDDSPDAVSAATAALLLFKKGEDRVPGTGSDG